MADWSGSTMARLVPPPPMVRRGSIVEEMARAGGAEALRTSQTQAARRRGSFDTAQAPAAAMRGRRSKCGQEKLKGVGLAKTRAQDGRAAWIVLRCALDRSNQWST